MVNSLTEIEKNIKLLYLVIIMMIAEFGTSIMLFFSPQAFLVFLALMVFALIGYLVWNYIVFPLVFTVPLVGSNKSAASMWVNLSAKSRNCQNVHGQGSEEKNIFIAKAGIENSGEVLTKILDVVKQMSGEDEVAGSFAQLAFEKFTDNFKSTTQKLLATYYLKDMQIDSLKENILKIKRNTHGASHAVRVMILAYYIIVTTPGLKDCLKGFDNLFVGKDSFEDIVLWCALLHDSGRKGGGADFFDHLSGANIAMFLHNERGFSPLSAFIIGKYAEYKDEPLEASREVASLIKDPENYSIRLPQSLLNKLRTDGWKMRAYHGHLGYENSYDLLAEQVKREALGCNIEVSLAVLSHIVALADCLDIQRCKARFHKDIAHDIEYKLNQSIGCNQSQIDRLIAVSKSLVYNTYDDYQRKANEKEAMFSKTRNRRRDS